MCQFPEFAEVEKVGKEMPEIFPAKWETTSGGTRLLGAFLAGERPKKEAQGYYEDLHIEANLAGYYRS